MQELEAGEESTSRALTVRESERASLKMGMMRSGFFSYKAVAKGKSSNGQN
jgi:hypothetical protein